MTTIDLLNIVTPPEWMADAACALVDPELFHPPQGHAAQAKQAKQVCATCPVRSQCLEFALAHDERFGVWGGESARTRRALVLARVAQPAPRPVGPQTRQRVAEIRRLTGAGLNARQVADRIGCTPRTVQRLRATHGIPASRVPGQNRGAA